MKRAVFVGLLILISVSVSGDDSRGEAGAIPLKNYELVRNGGFYLGDAGWLVVGSYAGPSIDAAFDKNSWGLAIATGTQSEPQAYAMQQLYPPTSISQATISMKYRLAAQQGSYFGGLQIALASTVNNQMQPVIPLASMTQSNYVGGTWQSLALSLTKQQLAQINSIRAQGLPLYVYVGIQGTFMTVHLDNVSMLVDGSMTLPQMKGNIALTLNDESKVLGKFQIWTIQPDGQNARKYFEAEGACYGLDWRPDGKAIVFASSHEKAYSRFSADIYELQGTGVRKITNPPNHSQAVASGRGKGTVVGKVYNQTDRNIVVAVHVEGAEELVFVSVGPYPNGNHTVEYMVPDVTDMGSGQQYINAREGDYVWLAALGADVQPGRTVRGGDIYLTSTRASFTATSPTYTNDGRQIIYAQPMMQAVPVTGGIGSNPYGWKGSINVISAAHSPVNNSILYQAGFGNGIFLVSPGSDAVKLVGTEVGLGPEHPSWLADGSGFVYIQLNAGNGPKGKNIYYYNFQNRQAVPVTQLFNEWAEYPSVSPDGKYIVFERVLSYSSNTDIAQWREVWIMQSDNQNIMWPLVRQGNPRFPRWK